MNEKFHKFLSSNKGETFKDFVFGFQDGLISTYALLIGIGMLVLMNPSLLLMALLAEVAAGALSMGFGAYISTKTKNEFLSKSQHDTTNIDKLQEFYKKKGLDEREIEVVESFSKKNPDLWLKLSQSQFEDSLKGDPVNNALYMGFAFVLGGMLSVAPYFLPSPIWSFLIATILSFSALFVIGIFRSFFSEKHWLKPALEMILIGVFATIIIGVYLYFISLTYGLLLLA